MRLPHTILKVLHVAVLGLRLHIDSALANVDPEAAAGLHPAADIAHQLILKAAAVQSLQDHLAQLAQNDLVHMVLSLLLVYALSGRPRLVSAGAYRVYAEEA